MVSATTTPLNRLLEPVARCFTPDVAKLLVELRPDPEPQARIDELAAKANGGTLTEIEREEYEGYVEAIDVVSVLQAKARNVLARQS